MCGVLFLAFEVGMDYRVGVLEKVMRMKWMRMLGDRVEWGIGGF